MSKSKNGLTLTRLYKAWYSMRMRCKPEFQALHKQRCYRGVTHCPEWETFEGFRDNQPAGRPFEQGLQLARFGDKGNYEPSNCRWATAQENRQECADGKKIRFPDGRAAIEVAASHGVPAPLFRCRYYVLGWDMMDAATRKRGARGTNGAKFRDRPEAQ